MKRKDGKPTKNGTKMLYCYAYDAFVKMLKLPWDMPTYTQEDHDPFVPDETELDALIHSAKSKLLAAFLQCLKETFGDPGEVLRIKWLDVDVNNKAISILYPVKNHMPRTLQVSNRLLAMIEALPKKDDRVFATSYSNMLRRFVTMRKRTADIHQNPKLLAVDFTAFRTWAGTMIAYHTNGNVLTVKKLLGHKQVKNTMKYIGRIEFKNSDLARALAESPDLILNQSYNEILLQAKSFLEEENYRMAILEAVIALEIVVSSIIRKFADEKHSARGKGSPRCGKQY
jgi:integrase